VRAGTIGHGVDTGVTRFSQLPLLWRVFAINAALLVVATLVLALNPLTISARLAFVQGIDLAVGLAVMLTANLLLLRPIFAPLQRLVGRMRTVDLLRPGSGSRRAARPRCPSSSARSTRRSSGSRPSIARAAGAR